MPNRPANPRLIVALTCLILGMGFVLAACGGDGESGDGAPPPASTQQNGTTTSTATSPTTETETRTGPDEEPEPSGMDIATLYFADAEAQRLVEETRSVQGPVDVRAALVALSGGPDTAGSLPAFPSGTEVVGTLVEDGEALVNLNQAFVDGYPSGGAAAEFAVLASIVYTATAVSGVERVRITVDGQVPAPAGSQYDWSGTFTRSDFPDAVAGS